MNMKNIFCQFAFFSPLFSLVFALNPSAGLAATVTYEIEGITDSGLFINETYSGLFSFDDAALTPDFTGFLSVSSVQFTFLGTNFSQVNAAATPTVSFENGTFLGLSFSVENVIINSDTVSFSVVPGFFDTSDSFFSYEVNQISGAGDITYTLAPDSITVPEPSLSLGLLGLGLIGLKLCFKRN